MESHPHQTGSGEQYSKGQKQAITKVRFIPHMDADNIQKDIIPTSALLQNYI
jgi:hypothetical protein